MNDKRKKALWIQLVAGLLTCIMGCLTCAYGYCSLVGKINGNIIVSLFMLGGCLVSITICAVLTLKNIDKRKKTEE